MLVPLLSCLKVSALLEAVSMTVCGEVLPDLGCVISSSKPLGHCLGH